jgi:hypothetical protein
MRTVFSQHTALYTVPYYCAQDYGVIRSIYDRKLAVFSSFTVRKRSVNDAVLIDLGSTKVRNFSCSLFVEDQRNIIYSSTKFHFQFVFRLNVIFDQQLSRFLFASFAKYRWKDYHILFQYCMLIKEFNVINGKVKNNYLKTSLFLFFLFIF